MGKAVNFLAPPPSGGAPYKKLRVLTELGDFFFSPAQRRKFYSLSRSVSFLQIPHDMRSRGQSYERRIQA